jgi:hypothetical protein
MLGTCFGASLRYLESGRIDNTCIIISRAGKSLQVQDFSRGVRHALSQKTGGGRAGGGRPMEKCGRPRSVIGAQLLSSSTPSAAAAACEA